MNHVTDDTPFAIVTAPNRDSLHWTPGTVTWGELAGWMEHPAKRKACGNYMMGTLKKTTVAHRKDALPCTDYHRTKLAVLQRSAVTLDVDYPQPGFEADAVMLLGSAFIMHTTYSSTPGALRFRLIVPLDRAVAPDEYYTIAGALMQRLGVEQFDKGSVQPERYMFKPSESEPGYFHHYVQQGPPAVAEALLGEFQSDLSELPAPKPHKNKRDPFALQGTMGAFNRAYEDFATLIEEYELPYVPAGADRWQLAGAAAAAGMGEVAPGLVFSHHANDPAYGQTCSAFDLARLHLYGHLDEDKKEGTPVNRLPSSTAMLELATQDLRVVRELVGADFDTEMDGAAAAIEQDNWRLRLRLDPKTGQPLDVIENWDLIASNDAGFRALCFNEMTVTIEADAPLPWREVTPITAALDGGDRASLALYIEREYHIRPGRAYLDDIISDRARTRRVNPVQDYLHALEWDGTPRVETCLPGVRPTPFTRLVARKVMAAAVARMLDPGCKWDHMLVLHGPEGLGKSHWVDRMAKGYSAALGKLGDKDTFLIMQRSWIMTADEAHALRQADFNAQKEFLTRTHDTFRMPYDREARMHPRHCVVWGTTNDDVFLRRQEGNRRFLIVRCEAKVDFAKLTDAYVDQVWAEALHLYRSGELLYLTEEESDMAAVSRESFTEEDALAGVIKEYLDTPVPADWDTMGPETRQAWLMNGSDFGSADNMAPVNQVCSLQIWVEALGRRPGDHKRTDLLEINTALKQLPGWKQLPGRRRIPGYGPQLVFQRDPEDTFSDLL